MNRTLSILKAWLLARHVLVPIPIRGTGLGRLLALLLFAGSLGLAPAQAQTCNQTSLIDYRNSAGTATEVKKTATETASGTSFTFGGYSVLNPASSTQDIFELSSAFPAQIDGRALVWRQQRATALPAGTTSTDVNPATPYVTRVTLTFNRPVSNLSFVVQDIDKGRQTASAVTNAGTENTDELAFSATNGAVAVPLTSADVVLNNPAINTFVSGLTIDGLSAQGVRGTALNGDIDSPSLSGNATVTFAAPVTTVTMFFRNLNTSTLTAAGGNAPLRLQTISFERISWCGQANVNTTVTASNTPVNAGTAQFFTVTYSNPAGTGVDAANGIAAQVQLSPNLTGVTFSGSSANFTPAYNPATGLVTFTGTAVTSLTPGETLSTQINFTVPANTATITATSTISTTANDPNAANNTATAVIETRRIAGNIFEDVNYGGGAGRPLATAGTTPVVAGTRVELYAVAAGAPTTLLAATTTDANGNYTFASGQTVAGQGSVPTLANGQSYAVRVVNNATNTVTSSRLTTAGTTGVIPVQTFVSNGVTNDGNRVGGEAPSRTDAAAGTAYGAGTGTLFSTLTPAVGTTAVESFTVVTLPATGNPIRTGVDFGFNYSTVVNINASGQGSLAQFIANSNALSNTNLAQVGQTAGKEVSIFMISDGRTTGAPAGTRSGVSGGATGGIATINLPATATITDANTTIDGLTQSNLYGNPNAPANETTTGPEVTINFGGTASSLVTSAANTRIANLGFTNGGAAGVIVVNGAGATGAVIEGNTVFNTGVGLRLAGSTGATVDGNIFRNVTNQNSDGIELTASSNNTITNNQLLNNAGYGLDFITDGSNGNTITGNLFKNNGLNSSNGQTAGLGIRSVSSNNTISSNTFTGNFGDGISAKAGNNVFSQNSFFNNGDLAIDLTADITDTGNDGDGAVSATEITTKNDNGDADTGANGLLNFPVITSATISGGNLVVKGFARAGSKIELYGAAVDASGFGEGQTYLGTVTDNGAAGGGNLVADTDLRTGLSYSGPINGRIQGADNSASGFTFTIPLGTGAGQVSVTTATVLTATATLSGGTSEFSGNAAVVQNVAPVAQNITNAPAMLASNGQTAIQPLVATDADGTVDTYKLNSIPVAATQGVLYYDLAGTYTAITTANFAALNLTPAQAQTLRFDPVGAFVGTASFTYSVLDNFGLASNVATYQIPVVAPLSCQPSYLDNATTSSGLTGEYYNDYFYDDVTFFQRKAPLRRLDPTVDFSTSDGQAAWGNLTGVANGTTADYDGFSARYRGSLYITTAGSYTFYLSSDDASYLWLDAAALAPTLDNETIDNGRTHGVQEVSATVTLTAGLHDITVVFGELGGGNRLKLEYSSAANNIPRQVIPQSLLCAGPAATNAPPVAQNITNTRLLDSDGATVLNPNLAGTDADGTVAVYNIETLPAAASGVLRYNGVAVVVGQAVLPANLGLLTFDPAAGSFGPASFTYSVTDNGGRLDLNPKTYQVPVLATPVPRDVTNATVPNNSAPVVLNPNLSATANGTAGGVANTIVSYTVNPASIGTLFYNNSPVTAATVVPAGNLNLLTYQPILGSTVTATFTYTATDANNVASTTHADNAGTTITAGPATYTIPVSAAADVTTTIAGPTTLIPGLPSGNYTAAFTNNGPNQAAAVTQQVTLPAGAANVLVNGLAYTPAGNVIDFGTAATLNSGATNTFNFSFTAPTTSGTVAVVSNVTTGSSEGANTAVNSASLSVAVAPTANVATTITAGAAPATAGQTGTFNVTFSNGGPATAAGVVAKVQLPVGLLGVVAANGGTYDPLTGVVTYAGLTSLATNASSSSAITFTAPTASPVTATSSISTTTSEGGQKANNTANASIGITPTYDVTTRLTGPVTTAVGVQTTFSVSTINNGVSVAPNAVQTVTGLPTNLSNVYVSNGGVYNAMAGSVTFPALAALASGAQVDNTISFTPTTTTAGFTATATVTANTDNTNDANTTNNSVAASPMAVNAAPATTNANLYTTITTPSANVAPGAAATFAVTSGNSGIGTATAVAQFVTLPSGLSGVVVKNSVGTTLAGAYNATTGVVTFPAVASLASGASAQYTIDITAPTAGVVAAVATISGATTDTMPSNNIATADVTVTPATDVTVRLIGPNSAPAGTSVTYTATTTNNGPAAATNVATSVAIPTGLTGVVVSGSGTYNSLTGVVTFPASANLLNGASTSNTITYAAPNIGTFANVASVVSTTTDNLLTNNTAVVTTVAEPLVDVVVSLNGPATIVQGNQVDYVVSAINNGTEAAINSVIRVQLPKGLAGLMSTGGTYVPATGVLTFPAIASQATGTAGAVSYAIRFPAPVGTTSLYAVASVTTDSEETSYVNNSANLSTAATPVTAGQADLRITVTSAATVNAGQPLTLTVSATNLGTSTVAATNVIQRVTLEPGLVVSSITNGGTYDAVTGVVTFPAVGSIAIGASAPTNTIVLVAPGATPLSTSGLVTGDQSDPTLSNNVAANDVVINPIADVTTAVSGPTAAQPGDLVNYSVVTRNVGPSVATGVVQTVTLPLGATNIVAPGGSIAGNVVTYPSIAALVPGVNGQVVSTISFNNPAAFTTSYDVVGNVTTTSTQPTAAAASDAATFTTAKGNRAPVANAVTNALQAPAGNTAGALPISALSGTDADGAATIASYAITTLPDAATQGTLRLDGSPVAINQVVAVGDIAKLTFDPVSAFVGNAFFTYTVLDNAGAVSAPAVYTIPVGQDQNSSFVAGPLKGGANQYQNGDLIATVVDVNGADYNAAAAVVDSGVRNVVPDAAGATTLATYGLVLNTATGVITVADRTKLRAGTYSINVTTIDEFGGTNTTAVQLLIGAFPLPVELTAFDAQAVKNVDAHLTWRTASEKNNDHFDVERSLNGTDFVKIGQVKGQGNSSVSTDYALTDAGVGPKAAGLVYYRLKQVDADGTATFSPVRTVSFDKVALAPAIGLAPNPATANTKLDLTLLPAGTYQVSVLDATGRVVLSTKLAAGLAHPLDVNTLASGTYLVLVRGQHNDQFINLSKRLVKE